MAAPRGVLSLRRFQQASGISKGFLILGKRIRWQHLFMPRDLILEPLD
jgi:hypothetical protein